MNCKKCGVENVWGSRFCIKCGTPIETQISQRNISPVDEETERQIPAWQDMASPAAGSGNVSVNVPVGQVIPDYNPTLDYTPLGMWSYFGYDILFMIPLVGILLLIVFSVGGTSNINLRNYARSKFCLIIILSVILLLLIMLGGGLAAYTMMA